MSLGACETLSGVSKTGVSVSLLWESWKPNPSAFQGQDDQGISMSLCQNRRLGLLDVRCRTFYNRGRTFWYFCPPVTHPVGIGFEFIVIVPLLLSYGDFHFFFERGISISVCFDALRLIVVQQLVAVMVQEETNRHPPTPPSLKTEASEIQFGVVR